MKINIPFGTALTRIAQVPPQALLPFKDPFEQRKTGRFWVWFLVTLAALATAGIVLWNQWTKRQEARQQQTKPGTTIVVTNAITVTNVTAPVVTNAAPATNAPAK
jgi:hypothetical protein